MKYNNDMNKFLHASSEKYIEELGKRRKESKVYSKHQLVGLALSQILEDEKHKSLYMKLAKEYNQDELIALAKRVAENKNVKNKGAYFMSVWISLQSKTKKRKKS